MTDQPSPPRSPQTSAQTRVSSEPDVAALGFGPYAFLHRLGEGGMGEVWLAEQLRPLRRQVAIKIVKAGMDTAQVIARFDAERQALAVMDHPAIAKVFDAGTTPAGRPYFAMEYVRGEAIASFCDRQRLSIDERLELFIQLCDGVQHAHQKGIIHRDLKPSNVLVSVAGDRPTPRIIDFGIAKAVTQPLTERPLVTEVGGFLGTPEYMSPEQAQSTPVDVDTRSDVYSLGVVLYELLVGALPFDGAALRQAGVDEIRRTIVEKDPPRPSTRITRSGNAAVAAEHRRTQPAKLVGQVRGDLDWIALKALEKDRTRRYQTANALALDVRRYLSHEPVSASPPSKAYLARKFVRRHRVGVAMLAGIGLLLIAVAGVMTVQAGRIARARDRANSEAAIAKQVSDFLVSLFEVSDPSQSRGRTLTARELLTSGAQRIETGLRDQPDVQARLQSTIGAVYTGLGLYDDAQPLLERALQTQRRIGNADSPEALTTANLLANAYWYQGNYAAAEPLYRQIVDRRTALLGVDHPETLKASFDLASLYGRQKRWQEFERAALDTLARQRRVLGEDHADTLASRSNLGTVYDGLGRHAEALPILADVADRRTRLLGETHPSTLISRNNLAVLNTHMGRFDEAESQFQSTLTHRRRILGEGHPSTANSHRNLAWMYSTQKRFVDAERTLLEAYDRVGATGRENPALAGIVEEIIKLYQLTGRPAKVAEWQGKLAASR